MNNLKPILFLIPFIALCLVTTLYFYELKKIKNHSAFHKFIYLQIGLGFLLNFTWELIQIPLYKNGNYTFNHISFCALATLADVIMVLLLYFFIAIVFKKFFWIGSLNIFKIAILIFLSGIGAVVSEMWHLSNGSWAYSAIMPIIPFVKVGLAPVLQFVFLPLIIYTVSFYCLKKYNSSIKNNSNNINNGY